MPDHESEGPDDSAAEKSAKGDKPAAKTKPATPEANQSKPDEHDGTLMAAALFNLEIAQQYIDETRYLPEHRLACFHYGVALLAAYRNDPLKRIAAAQCFSLAASWRLETQDPTKQESIEKQKSIDRIVCESEYNLGVIDELDKKFDKDPVHYRNALRLAENRFKNVEILARLGILSWRRAGTKRIFAADDADVAAINKLIDGVESPSLRVDVLKQIKGYLSDVVYG
jgi:hypothetical protein